PPRPPTLTLFPYTTLFRSLLGPRDGMDEEIVGTPRARYPVGALAPVTVDPDLLVETGPTKEAESTTNRTAGNPGDDGQVISDVEDRKSTRLNSSHVSISYA